MWAIRVLTGSNRGKMYPLKTGKNIVGRAPTCNIQIASPGISKTHAQIYITEDKIIISDLKSSNGTFVNGLQVQNHKLNAGDKFALHDIIFDVFLTPDNVLFSGELKGAGSNKSIAPIITSTPAIIQDNFAQNTMSPRVEEKPEIIPIKDKPVKEQIEYYIEEVAMPGVYRLTEVFDFKFVIMGFVLLFITVVTVLSTIPVTTVIRDHVTSESQRRAVTIARRLADFNRQAIIDENFISTSIDPIRNEHGVDQAFLVSSMTGDVIAPSNKMGTFLDLPFVHAARKSNKEESDVMVEDNKVAVSVPIAVYNSDLGERHNLAHAVVILDMNQTALGFENTLSIFIQILILAFLAGALLYFVLFRVVSYPIHTLNKELDSALKEGTDNISLSVKFDALSILVANVNSALSRMNGGGPEDLSVSGDKSMEAEEVVSMFPVTSFAIDNENDSFIAINEALGSCELFDDPNIQGKLLGDLTDPSLSESLRDLLGKAMDNPNLRHANILPSKGVENYEITAKAILDNGQISYFLFVITEIYDDDDEELVG